MVYGRSIKLVFVVDLCLDKSVEGIRNGRCILEDINVLFWDWGASLGFFRCKREKMIIVNLKEFFRRIWGSL